MRKRKHSTPAGDAEPASKRAKVEEGTSAAEESHVSTFARIKDSAKTPEGLLKFQNEQLGNSLHQQRRVIANLESTITNLETRALEHDAELSCTRRHWNALDRELRVVLSRLDASVPVPTTAVPSAGVETFKARMLADLPEAFEDLDAALAKRCEVSKEILGRVVDVLEKAPGGDASGKSALDAIQAECREAVAKVDALSDQLLEVTASYRQEKALRGDVQNELDAAYRKIDRINAELKHVRETGAPAVDGEGENGELDASMERTELEIQRELAKSRLEELEGMKAELQRLEKAKAEVENRPATELANEQVAKSRLYGDLARKLALVEKECGHARARADHLQGELVRLQQERRAGEAKMKETAALREKSLSKELAEVEQMMDRYKSERNALSYRLQQKEGSQTDTKTLHEYKEMCKIQKAETEKFKKEVERYKAIIPGLKKRVASINEELANESKVDPNVQLGAEELARRLAKAHRTVHDLTEALNTQKMESTALLNEIEVIGEAFESTQEQNTRLLQQLGEKEDANTQLMSDRIKAKQLENMARDQKQKLVEKTRALEEKLGKQQEVLDRMNRRIKSQDDLLNKAREAQYLLEASVEEFKRKHRESSQHASELQGQLAAVQKSMEEYKANVQANVASAQSDKHKIRRLEEDTTVLKKKLSRTKSSGAVDAEMADELRSLQMLLRCRVCHVRNKSVIVTRCFHTFCRDCIESNLAARNRKCPQCSKMYSKDDVNPLYL